MCVCVAAEFDAGANSNKTCSRHVLFDEFRQVVNGDGKFFVSVMINRFNFMKEELFDKLAAKNREAKELTLCDEEKVSST